MNAVSTSGRELLTRLGIGNFNATGIVQYLFTAPSTTDPKSPAIMLLVQHIQRALNTLGAGLIETAYLDIPTANAMTYLVGPNWQSMSWADNVAVVLDSKKFGVRIPAFGPLGSAPAGRKMSGAGAKAPPPGALAKPMGAFGLPDVPGGMLTYALGAYLLYRHFKKKH